MNATDAFRTAMRTAGLDFAGPVALDGKLHRFKAGGDKTRNSWYVLHAGQPAAGCFGCWKRGFKEDWHEKLRHDFTDSEWENIRKSWKHAEAERERADQERQAKARKVAARILRGAEAVTAHAYLTAKGVRPHGELRQRGDILVLPLHDSAGELHSLQFIAPDKRFDGERDKTFLGGGRISGCFFTVADKPDGALVICEGYATGASIFEATGFAVVCAMNCGNLLAVSKALREKFPAREIIICADNDQFTSGNPGLTKATDAAKAISARLAVPHFKDAATKATDFNDLHQLEGLDTVKSQVEGAQVPKESDEEILQRLAALTPIEFDRAAEAEANALGCNVGTLRSEVEKRRLKSGENLQGGALNLADVEPWPEAVNGAETLNQVAETVSGYVALPDWAADASALWTAHTHCFESFQCSPRLNVTSPEKGCGKTTLRDVLGELVPRPLPTENLSVAVLFRVIESNRPTVLADECDSWLRDNEELRGLLNAGHRRGGQALRCEGDSNEVRAFNVFAPAVLCGIGALPGTLHDRSIVIHLERARPGEVRERFDSRRIQREQELCRKLARWCADNFARLEACDPALPSSAFNRLADNWRPLFAIAEIAGGGWPQRAATAFAKLTSREDTDAQGIGTMLLADIWQTFRASGAVRLFSKKLVESLLEMSDHPWPEAHKGRPITETWLARRLRTFGVSPKLIRVGDTVGRGYEVADFQEVIDRYLPAPGDSKCYSVTTPANKGENEHSEVLQPAGGVTLGNSQNANVYAGCNGVTVAEPPARELVEADLL